MYKALVNDVLAINKASNSNAGVSLWRHQIKLRWSNTDFNLAWVYLTYSNIKEAFNVSLMPPPLLVTPFFCYAASCLIIRETPTVKQVLCSSHGSIKRLFWMCRRMCSRQLTVATYKCRWVRWVSVSINVEICGRCLWFWAVPGDKLWMTNGCLQWKHKVTVLGLMWYDGSQISKTQPELCHKSDEAWLW